MNKDLKIEDLKFAKELLERGIYCCIETFYKNTGILPIISVEYHKTDLSCRVAKTSIVVKSKIEL